MDNARAVYPDLGYAPDIRKACQDADLVLHLTHWPEYGDIDPDDLAAVVRRPLLLDARNCLDARRWRSAGWSLHALGRPIAGAT
jgi:UDPglucose 6-dehydrogenase